MPIGTSAQDEPLDLYRRRAHRRMVDGRSHREDLEVRQAIASGTQEVPMAQLAPTPPVDEEPVALERKSRTWLWIVIGAVLVAVVAFAATSMLGKSVVFYKTPTEVEAAPGQHVRLAGTLVAGSVVTKPGLTTFSLTDGTTTIKVTYQGAATTAISTASQPGTQLVAEGALGTDGLFRSDNLLAKCPSKFQAGSGNGASSQ
jgi:cytochrome c-type biogenesis protein CcmE